MTTNRRRLIAGGLLAGAILVGTAGIAAAQDPTASPTPSQTWSAGNMMGGQGAGNMMGGQGAGNMMGGGGTGNMMGGGGAAGMMGGGGTAGMMGGGGTGNMMGSLTPEQLKEMTALHDEMLKSGTCDPAGMQAFHDQLDTTN